MARYSVSWKLKNGSKELTGTYSGIEAKSEDDERSEATKRLKSNHAKAFKDGYVIADMKVK